MIWVADPVLPGFGRTRNSYRSRHARRIGAIPTNPISQRYSYHYSRPIHITVETVRRISALRRIPLKNEDQDKHGINSKAGTAVASASGYQNPAMSLTETRRHEAKVRWWIRDNSRAVLVAYPVASAYLRVGPVDTRCD